MFYWKFSIDDQFKRYDEIRNKLDTYFYQNLKFYVLPTMPEKFRNRVVYLPNICNPKEIYKKHKIRINRFEKEWNKEKDKFLIELKKYFPKINSLDIIISLSLYGPIGSYQIKTNKIIIQPRYDRTMVGLKKLIINSLTHYYYFNRENKLNSNTKLWREKQEKSSETQNKILGINRHKKDKSMLKVLDYEFAGRLAEESVKYLKKIGKHKDSKIKKPKNLTRQENNVFDLFLENKYKLVTYDQIADVIWKEKSDEKYSEYAITKIMERLKKKVTKNSIHSQRKVGYILV